MFDQLVKVPNQQGPGKRPDPSTLLDESLLQKDKPTSQGSWNSGIESDAEFDPCACFGFGDDD